MIVADNDEACVIRGIEAAGLHVRSRHFVRMTLGNQRKGSVMFQRNRMLGMLEDKQLPLGIQIFTADAALIEVVGATGFDFVMLDSAPGSRIHHRQHRNGR